ncbi:MAG: hypothetical protein Q6363_000800, partial [Candidatus Njordarchaeota archaeon]
MGSERITIDDIKNAIEKKLETAKKEIIIYLFNAIRNLPQDWQITHPYLIRLDSQKLAEWIDLILDIHKLLKFLHYFIDRFLSYEKSINFGLFTEVYSIDAIFIKILTNVVIAEFENENYYALIYDDDLLLSMRFFDVFI